MGEMADHLEEWWDEDSEDQHDSPVEVAERRAVQQPRRPRAVQQSRRPRAVQEKRQGSRWRCLSTGCNPKLNEATAQAHKGETGHRVAKWPVRSLEGRRRAAERNQNGYYDQYNVGAKSRDWRELTGHLPRSRRSTDDEHPHSSEALGQW